MFLFENGVRLILELVDYAEFIVATRRALLITRHLCMCRFRPEMQ